MILLQKILKSNWFFGIVLLLIGFIYFQNSDKEFGWTNKKHFHNFSVKADGSGYYAYLPELFYYQDDYNFLKEKIQPKYPNEGFDYFTIPDGKGGFTNKCYAGPAVVLCPFFACAHIHAASIGEDTDGYSWPYHLWLSIGCIVVALFGFIGLRKLLLSLGLSHVTVLFTVFSLALATNLKYYSTIEMPMAHVFSFAMNSWALYFALKWLKTKTFKSLIFTALFLGLCFIIRPTNLLICLLIPFMVSSKDFVSAFVSDLKNKRIFLVFLLFLAVISIQFINIYEQTGKFGYNIYEGESFKFLSSPYIYELLLGFNRGLLIYCWIFGLAAIGLVYLFFKNRRMFYGVGLTFSVTLYLMASWWSWWYGGAFGMRALVDYFPIYFLPAAYLFDASNKWLKLAYIAFLGLSINVYAIMEYQYKNSILTYELYSDEHFKRSFLHTENRYIYSQYFKLDSIPNQYANEKLFQSSVLRKFGFDKKDKVYNWYEGQMYLPVFKVFSDSTLDRKIVGNYSFDVHFTIRDEFLELHEYFFKNGKEIKKNQYSYGCLIEKENEWNRISIPIYPDLKWNEVDSIVFIQYSHHHSDRFRNLDLKLNKKD
jgi:hypothetical protein